MAAIFTRKPILTSAATASVLAASYYASTPRKPLMLDSAQTPPSKTLTFPKNMLFSQKLEVTEVQQVNHDTKRITFKLPGGNNEVSGVTPGAAILTQHTPTGAWLPVFRPYTPVHDLDQPGVLQLLVKKYPEGKASSHLHSLNPGDELRVRGPLPGPPTLPLQSRDIICIAGGAGITPIYSLTKGILANPADHTRIHLLWGVNGTRDIVLKQELESLEKQHPDRLQVIYAVSGPEAQPGALDLGDKPKFRKGYVDRTLVQEAIAKCKQDGGWDSAKEAKVFLCGPPKMEDAMVGKTGVLTELGVGKKEVHRF